MLLKLVVVALIGVVPVDKRHLAVRAILQGDDLRPAVVGKQEVGLAVADVAGAGRLQAIHVEPSPMDVVHQELAAVAVGPGSTEIDHGA